MSIVQCRSCGHALGAGDNFCSGCGAVAREVAVATATCKRCGGRVPVSTRFCGECGVSEPLGASSPLRPRAKTVQDLQPPEGCVDPESEGQEDDMDDQRTLHRVPPVRFGPKRPIGLAKRPAAPTDPLLPAETLAFSRDPERPAPAEPRRSGGAPLLELQENEIDAALEIFGSEASMRREPPSPAETEGEDDDALPTSRTPRPRADGGTQIVAFPGLPEPQRPDAMDRTVVTFGLQPPRPFRGEDPAPGSTSLPERTVVARRPMAPAPFGGEPLPQPIEAVRLAVLGAAGEVVAERVVEPGTILTFGRDPTQPWAEDDQLLPRHAQLIPAPGGGLMVHDQPGSGPVFRRLEGRAVMREGDELRVGHSRLVLERAPGGRLELRVERSASRSEQVPIGEGGLRLGRDRGDVVFPEDAYVSSSHCRLVPQGSELLVEDLGSSNGTYLRVRPSETVPLGATLLLGQTQLRLLAPPLL